MRPEEHNILRWLTFLWACSGAAAEAAGARYCNVLSASTEALTAFSLLLVSMRRVEKAHFLPRAWVNFCVFLCYIHVSQRVWCVTCCWATSSRKRPKIGHFLCGDEATHRHLPNISQEDGLVFISILTKISLYLHGFRSAVNRKQHRRFFFLCLSQISSTSEEFLQTFDHR